MTGPRFDGRTFIVTGAGSGIGRAVTLRLLEEGAAVVAVDIDPARLGQLTADAPSPDRLRPVAGDLSAGTTVAAAIAAAGDRLDGVANVAGIMDGFVPVGELDDATWERVMRINVTAPMMLSRAAIPLLAVRGGSIVNVASEAALRGSAAGAAYTASKHALVGLTRSTAHMYALEGIRANAVAPGPVATGIDGTPRSQLGISRAQGLMQAVPLRPAEPGQLASLIVWLLSNESANVNGAVIPSDGGWSVA